MFDWGDIGNKLVVMAIGAAVGWVVTHITKLRRDVNVAFSKIRDLEDQIP